MRTRRPRIIEVKLEEGRKSKYTLYHSAEKFINKTLRRAEAKGVLNDPRERAVCKAALISAGIEVARSGGVKFVTAEHIKSGWRGKLAAYSPRICPPYRCQKRSIVLRKDELKNELPAFRSLVGDDDDE